MGIGGILRRGMLLVGLVVGLVFVGGSYWFSDTVAIKAARAVPVSEAQMPQYYEIVRDLTTRAPHADAAPLRLASAQPNASPRAATPARRRCSSLRAFSKSAPGPSCGES